MTRLQATLRVEVLSAPPSATTTAAATPISLRTCPTQSLSACSRTSLVVNTAH